jgi:YfdX protein
MAGASAQLESSLLAWFRAGLAAALLAVCCLGLTWPGPVWAEPQRQQEMPAGEPVEPVVQMPPGHALAQRDKLLSAAARTAVKYVDAAAQALVAGKVGQAVRLLAQSRRLLDQIQGGVQATEGAGHITVIPVMARVRLADGGELSDDLAAQVRALEPQVLAGEHDRVLAGLQDVGVGLTYEYLGMPVQATSDGIDRATAALAAGNSDAALTDLTAIVHGLEVRSLSVGRKLPTGHGPELGPNLR